jgi:nucleotide-binding universal stress UspA family protein
MDAISTAWRSLARPGFGPAPAVFPERNAPLVSQPHVLAITDLSNNGTNAAWRAALVARDRGLPLRIVTVRSGGLAQAQATLRALARELRERLHVTVAATAIHGRLLREGAAAARAAALVVLAAPGSNRLADWLLGTPAERLLRRSGTPVLLVRRTAYTSYRNVVVPVELRPESGALIAAGTSLSRDPRMKVFHVLDTDHEGTLRLADVPETVIRSTREKAVERARQALVDLIEAEGAHHDGAVPAIAFGNAPARVLEKEAMASADLLVLGKRRRRALPDFFRRGVARRVVAAAHADVLLVPFPAVPAAIATAPA